MALIAPPQAIAEVFARAPVPLQARLHQLRALIFAVAADDAAIGPLTETLKWGDPAFLTEASRSGTTVRLGLSKSEPEACAIFVNCQTSLIETFRSQFPTEFRYDGNRALILPADAPLAREALAICLHAALTYHQRKKSRARRRIQQNVARG